MRGPLVRWFVVSLAVASLGFGGAAFGATAVAGTSMAGNTKGIIIDEDAYFPARLVVQPGQVIPVTNEEGEDHSLTAKDGAFDTGVFETGTRTIVAPTQRGRYYYSCIVHGPRVMKGVLIVQG